MRYAVPALALIALAGCNDAASQKAENQADLLEEAAEQSTPAAAEVLENQAEVIREQGVSAPPGAPSSAVQDAMDKAGEAQAEALPGPYPQSDNVRVPESQQAVPHGAEKGNPPPKVDTGQ